MKFDRRAALLGALALAAQARARGRAPWALAAPPPGPRAEDLLVEGVAIRLWHPGALAPEARAILFSHGANAEARRYDALLSGWAAGGHLVAAVSHREPPQRGAAADLAEAQAGWRRRLSDMRAAARLLAARAPEARPIAAGHSYGALVAQVLGGARVTWPGDGGPLPLPGIARILAFSPPGPLPGFIEPAGWAEIAVPMFVQTGTADVVPPVAPRWEAHLASFEAARVSPRWLWMGTGVDHYFGNRIGRPERPADPDQARLFDAALMASLAFLEGGDPPAQPPGATLTVR